LSNAFVRAISSPNCAASVRIFFWRSSGLNGLPFPIPSGASMPNITLSRGSIGSG